MMQTSSNTEEAFKVVRVSTATIDSKTALIRWVSGLPDSIHGERRPD